MRSLRGNLPLLASVLAAAAVGNACFTYDDGSRVKEGKPWPAYVEQCLVRDSGCDACRNERCGTPCCDSPQCVTAISHTTDCLSYYATANGECWVFVERYDSKLLTCLIDSCTKECFPGPTDRDLPPPLRPVGGKYSWDIMP